MHGDGSRKFWIENCGKKDCYPNVFASAIWACPECGMRIGCTLSYKHMVCSVCKNKFYFACLSIKDKVKRLCQQNVVAGIQNLKLLLDRKQFLINVTDVATIKIIINFNTL